jgi:hypothetical protein
MSRRAAGPPFPEDDDVAAVADWAELSAVLTGSPLSQAKLRTTVGRENAVSSTLVEDAWAELQQRKVLFGGAWPFRLDETTLTLRRRPGAIAWYAFLAALGLRYNIDNVGRELFEHCVAEVVAGLTGRRGLRIGFPRRAPMPTSLAEAVRVYCGGSAEELGVLHPTLPTDGDLGLDVVSWIAFRDARGGYLHFIGQCATGADWGDKLTELNPFKWGDHISWAVQPVRFFATPVIVRLGEFRRASKDGGLILDRPRLLALHEEAPLRGSTKRRVEAYCAELYRG